MTSRRSAGVILASLTFANVVAYAARNELFAVYPALRDRFALHDAKLGLLATAFLVPHALATLPFGWAADRWDRRRVIALGLVLGSVAGALGALAGDTWTLVATRAGLGLGTAAVVPAANSIIGQLYEGPHKASRMAIFNLGLLVGGVTGLASGQAVGFPDVVVVLAVPGIAVGLVIALLPVPPRIGRAKGAADASIASAGEAGDHVDPSTSFSQLGAGFFTSAKRLIRISTLRWLMLSATAMAFAAGGYNAWLIDYLERDKGMSSLAATDLLGMALVGAVAGVLTGARLADRARARVATGRLWVIAAGMALTVPVTIASIVLPPGLGLYIAGTLTLFFMSWYHAPMAVTVDDLAPPAQSAAAQGLVICTMHLLGTAPSSWILGMISDRWSLYTAMWVPLAAILIAALAMLAATRRFTRDAAKHGGAARASL